MPRLRRKPTYKATSVELDFPGYGEEIDDDHYYYTLQKLCDLHPQQLKMLRDMLDEAGLLEEWAGN